MKCNNFITINMKKIKKEIQNKGLKISWLAEQLKISQPALSMYLNEKRAMPTDIELKLKQLLK